MADLARARRYARAGARWARLLAAGKPDTGVRVFYGHDRVPAPGDAVAGGTAKIQRLARRFPNHPTDFSLPVSRVELDPARRRRLAQLARRRDIPVVLNQDGVGYPGWAGDETEQVNAPIRELLEAADHVLYQSAFCKRSADEWARRCSGERRRCCTTRSTSSTSRREEPPGGGPVLLLGGDQTQAYRLELALRTLAALLPPSRTPSCS
jgi:hypothetical protein